MRNAGNLSITNNNLEMSRIVLNAVLFILAALAFWYVLILGNMVFDIVQRKTLEKEMLALSNEVGQLELAYLSITGAMDLSGAFSMGFKEVNSAFATRKSIKSLGSLTLGSNEI